MPKKTTKKTVKKDTPKTIIEKEIVKELKEERSKSCNNHKCHTSGGALYFVGFIGAAKY